MSEKFNIDGSQVDIETATEVRNQSSGEAGSPKSDRTNSPGMSILLYPGTDCAINIELV